MNNLVTDILELFSNKNLNQEEQKERLEHLLERYTSTNKKINKALDEAVTTLLTTLITTGAVNDMNSVLKKTNDDDIPD